MPKHFFTSYCKEESIFATIVHQPITYIRYDLGLLFFQLPWAIFINLLRRCHVFRKKRNLVFSFYLFFLILALQWLVLSAENGDMLQLLNYAPNIILCKKLFVNIRSCIL